MQTPEKISRGTNASSLHRHSVSNHWPGTTISIAVASEASFSQLQRLFGIQFLVGDGARLIHTGSASTRQFCLFTLAGAAVSLALAWLVQL